MVEERRAVISGEDSNGVSVRIQPLNSSAWACKRVGWKGCGGEGVGETMARRGKWCMRRYSGISIGVEVSRRYFVRLVGARGPGDWDGQDRRSV